VEKLSEFAAAGVSEVALGFPMRSEAVYLEQIEFFGTEVLPIVAGPRSVDGPPHRNGRLP
jgi:hypothetical protein